MKPHDQKQSWISLDLIIPVGALLVICFSLGSVFLDGTNHFASSPPSEVLKAYRKDASAIVH